MNNLKYSKYTMYRCDKCNDQYQARYARFSDRTSCRYHFWIKEPDGSFICRDCKKYKHEITCHNCYHTSAPNRCFRFCTIL